MNAGLCSSCTHSSKVLGARSTFVMCDRSRTDPSYPRYPRLPMLACRGYEPKPATEPAQGVL
jgi:hypothetical protein